MKRRILPRKTLVAESAAITQFMFDATTPVEGGKLPLQSIFAAYNQWRARSHMPPSELTIDGFGRLFPHTYPRKSTYWHAAKHSLKCVLGLGLSK